MRTILISNDKELRKYLQEEIVDLFSEIIIFDKVLDPLELLSEACKNKPSLLIIDDDLTKPNSLLFLKSVKKLYDDISIIFLTSNESIELGREVSQIGVIHYSVKPINTEILCEYIKSIKRLKLN